MHMKSIMIRSVERSSSKKPEELIRWFCYALGLSNDEETGIEEQILIRFAYAAKKNEGIPSSAITIKPEIARSTIIYHLNRLIDSGLIVKKGRKYYLRATEMSKAIEEIEYDLNREIMKMLAAAKEFDRLINQKGRNVKIR